ncbi:MAG: histidine--tRNA ligase [Deltaproteobacteria bacterium]|nr:histidine--tRNA ligase [Deltaproteobacteria bacterium]
MEITTIKGFKDILPEEIATWQRVESEAIRVFSAFGFMEIRSPLLERTELFSRSIGQDTDIVSKEMYSFADSKGRGLTLRPEATASVVRAYIQHRLYKKNPVQKLFIIGPMFRHERPQKGRFRQFHQIDAEIIGDPGPMSDADIIVMTIYLLEAIGLSGLSLHINSLGCPQCRTIFREELKDYLVQRTDDLCTDCRRRAEVNPLRVFDCKVEACKGVVSGAPSILDFICEDCQGHFISLQGYLERSDIPFILNHKLVRGLDYYTRTTFEIQSDRLGSQNAVVGGGRYDGLVKRLGGPDHPGIGFAIGVERLITLLKEGKEQEVMRPELFIAGMGDRAGKKVFNWVNELRRSGILVEMEYASKGLKAQMKRADRLGAKKVLIVGDDELSSGKGILRDMETKVQQEVDLDNLMPILSRQLLTSKE